MGSLHYFHVWAQPHDPRREEHRGELRLGMTRGHVHDKALTLALRYRFELFGEELMVLAFDEAVPYVFNVIDEVCLRFLFDAQLLDSILNYLYTRKKMHTPLYGGVGVKQNLESKNGTQSNRDP
jgi:hypothetical protein